MSADHLRRVLAGVALATLAPSSLAAYVFTSISYPGATSTQVFGLNNSGKVAGGATTDAATGAGVGFVFDVATNTFSVLPLTSGGLTVRPLAINDAGALCGASFDPVTLVAVGQIYSAGSYTAFSFPGRTNTNCRAINGAGTVTGYAENGGTDAIGFIHAGSGFTPIDFPGSTFQITQGINAAGTVVGSVIQPVGAVFAGSPAGNYGFVRSAAGVVTQFRVNGLQTRARGINDSDKLAGWLTLAGGDQRGFVIDAPSGGGFVNVTLDPANYVLVPGSANTIVEGINNLGHLSGIFDAGAGTDSIGFVATIPVDTLIDDLADLIAGMALPRGTERSLMSKLEAADAAIARGNTSAACSQLQALINHARAQSGRSLTTAQADALIASTLALRSALGC